MSTHDCHVVHAASSFNALYTLVFSCSGYPPYDFLTRTGDEDEEEDFLFLGECHSGKVLVKGLFCEAGTPPG